MSFKVKASYGNTPIQETKAMERAYQTLASSTQQKLFEKVLNQFQLAGNEGSQKEIDSFQGEILDLQRLQASHANGQNIDPAPELSLFKKPDMGGMNKLATSALLKLTALSSKGENFNNYAMKALGAGSGAGSSSRTGAESVRSDAPESTRDVKSIGALAARFESGDRGLGVIGYDDQGGTSYGVYQISSRAGTMRRFIDYLQEHAPNLAKRLKAAGPSDTGSRRGAMPAEWKRIANEDPERFASLQQDFIEETHFIPALQEIHDRTGVNIEKHSRALQEVLWSTAVQHGPKGAANIFCKAISRAGAKGQGAYVKDLIDSVYSTRARQFAPSTPEVRGAVQGRFQEERAMALAMLKNDVSKAGVDA